MTNTETGQGGGALPSAARTLHNWLLPVFNGLAILSAVCGGAIVIIICVSVAMRHIAQAPLHFTEELVGLLMTAAFFLAMPLVTLKAENVRVMIVIANLPARLARRVALAAGLFGVAFCLWYFALCLPWLEFAFDRNLKTEVARLLMYPWMAVIPFSLLLTAMAFAIRSVAGPLPQTGG
ncbi:MAG: TRAP transporter small permease [Pseudomonadota bacterium]